MAPDRLGLVPIEGGIVFKGTLLGVLSIALIVLYAIYNAFFHPLRRYPGPFLWRAFRLPYVVSIHRGDMHRRLKDFHDRYGSVVRVAPNELSYQDGQSRKDIYLNRPGHVPFPRNPTWFVRKGENGPSSIMGADEEDHARLRRAYANSFSEKSLKDQAPVIEAYVETFIRQLKLRTGQCIDLMSWLEYLTFDISGDLSFGESFDCLQNGKAHPWVEIAHDFGKGLALIATVNQYPPLNRCLRYILPQKIIQRRLDHHAMSAAKARKRLDLQTDRPDFVTPTKQYADKKDALTTADWELNMSIIVFAGSETTSSALSAIVRELVQNRGVLYNLTQEIRNTFKDEADINIASTGGLKYLNAVINEGLRLDPPAVIGVPRVVPKEGDTICGEWIPGGTYVTAHQYPSNRSARNFRHPNSFIPERFLHPDPKTDDMSTFQPFSFGRHSCIGMKLAYAEMRLILTRVLYSFDIALADERDRWDWGDQPAYIFWEKLPLNVVLKKAERW